MKSLILLAASDLSLLAEDGPPEAKDVVAGWTGFAVIIGLVIATALLCWSFARQVKKTNRAQKRGVFGDVPESTEGEAAQDEDGSGVR